MPSRKNVETVKELADKIKKASSIIMVDNTGLDAISASNFRKKVVTESTLEYFIVKNTLFRNALKDAGISLNLNSELKGQSSFLLCYTEGTDACKISAQFAKQVKGFQIKTGIFEGKKLSSKEIEYLSKIPSKEALIAQLVVYMKLPLFKLHGILKNRESNLKQD